MKSLKINFGRKLDRRQFLKASGLASAALGSTGLGFFGYEAGKDPESYSGWENFEGANQTFNRKRKSVDQPTYKKIGPAKRPDARTEVIFQRRSLFMRQWKDEFSYKNFLVLMFDIISVYGKGYCHQVFDNYIKMVFAF